MTLYDALRVQTARDSVLLFTTLASMLITAPNIRSKTPVAIVTLGLCSTLFSAAFSAPVRAAPILRYVGTGEVTSVIGGPDLPDYGISIGSTVTFSTEISATPLLDDTRPDFTTASYSLTNTVLSVGNFSGTQSSDSLLGLEVLDALTPTTLGGGVNRDIIDFFSDISSNVIAGRQVIAVLFSLFDTTRSVFDDTSLPFPFPPLSGFDEQVAEVRIGQQLNIPELAYRFQINSLVAEEIPLPLPSSLALFALGFLALRRRSYGPKAAAYLL